MTPTILLVDDDKIALMLYVQFLRRNTSYELLQAGSGEEALELLQEHGERIDVIVTDLEMSGISGLQLIEKAFAAKPELQTIIVTGRGDFDTVIEAMQLGAANYLQKPVELKLLHLAIERCLEKLKLIRAVAARKESEIIQATRMHRDRLAALGEMATAMAHEINQPLNIINITVQSWALLKKRGSLQPEKMLADVDKLMANVSRISKIIDHVRILGRTKNEMVKASLASVIDDALSLCRMQFKTHGITLEEEFQGHDLPQVSVVCSELEQVLLNIIGNARYAVEERKRQEPAFAPCVRVEVAHAAEEERVKVVVTDNGDGIPAENAERIFDHFFTTKPPGEGTGLGLGIGLQIMRKFGGGIELKQGADQGAIFEVWLPVCKAEG